MATFPASPVFGECSWNLCFIFAHRCMCCVASHCRSSRSSGHDPSAGIYQVGSSHWSLTVQVVIQTRRGKVICYEHFCHSQKRVWFIQMATERTGPSSLAHTPMARGMFTQLQGMLDKARVPAVPWAVRSMPARRFFSPLTLRRSQRRNTLLCVEHQ